MTRHIVKKILAVIPTLILVSMILFTIISLLPGDAALGVAGEAASQQDIAKIRTEKRVG